jgi:hypothetical protein
MSKEFVFHTSLCVNAKQERIFVDTYPSTDVVLQTN